MHPAHASFTLVQLALYELLVGQHDPETAECSPGGTNGNYIMYARATSGDRPNNNKFSVCSKQAMAQVMAVKARGDHGCFIRMYLLASILNNTHSTSASTHSLTYSLTGILTDCHTHSMAC